MKPRLLVVLEAGDAWPSGVIRGAIYREPLSKHFDVTFMNRRPAALIRVAESRDGVVGRAMSAGGIRGMYALARVASIGNDMRIRAAAERSDIVYMSKVTSYDFVSRLREATTARLVLDFGDAVWLAGKGGRFNEILTLVDAVTTDNDYTAEYVRQFNPNCMVVPDAPQVEYFDRDRERLSAARGARDPDTIVLGWIGTGTTAYNLFRIWPSLERLSIRHPSLMVRLVGVARDNPHLPPFERVRVSARPSYDQPAMIEEVFGMDIGVFPMFDVEASVVRGILKATVYMSGEVPVVCSPVGQAVDVIRDGENGFLADGEREWERKLERLIADADLRQRMGRAGLETVRRDFTIDASFERLRAVLAA